MTRSYSSASTLCLRLVVVCTTLALAATSQLAATELIVSPTRQAVCLGGTASLSLAAADSDEDHHRTPPCSCCDNLSFGGWIPSGWTQTSPLQKVNCIYGQTCEKRFDTLGTYSYTITADDSNVCNCEDDASESKTVKVCVIGGPITVGKTLLRYNCTGLPDSTTVTATVQPADCEVSYIWSVAGPASVHGSGASVELVADVEPTFGSTCTATVTCTYSAYGATCSESATVTVRKPFGVPGSYGPLICVNGDQGTWESNYLDPPPDCDPESSIYGFL